METVAGDTTRLLAELGKGSQKAAEILLPVVYRELRALAQRHLHHARPDHTLQATALVHEAYLRLVTPEEVTPRDRNHFFALAAQAIRRILVDHAQASLDDDHAIPRHKGRTVDQLARDDQHNNIAWR